MWLQICENIAGVCNIPLFDTLDLSIMEFLNMMSYVNYKNKELEKKYKKQ